MELSRRALLAVTAWAPLAWGYHGPLLTSEADKWPDEPFLQGNFGPVRETDLVTQMPVEGQLPEHLHGMYLRNGPNPQHPPKGAYHWFDGDGMIHAVTLAEGKASYQSRFVQTDGYKKEKVAGRALWGGLLVPPDWSLAARGEPLFKNVANTALVWHHQKLLALWEGGEPYEVRLPTMETVGPYRFANQLQHAFTAHPKVDPQSGDMMFFGYRVDRQPYIQYAVVDRQGRFIHTAEFSPPRPIMMHDFAVTPNYSLFLDFPMIFDIQRLRQGLPPLGYQPELGARIGILGRKAHGSEIRWFEIQPGYVFHTLAAEERGQSIHLYGCRTPEYPTALEFSPGAAKRAPRLLSQALLYRWTVNLTTGQVKEGPVSDVPGEFPRCHEQWTGNREVGYLLGSDMNTLVQIALATGATTIHRLPPGCFAGEPVFVPLPNATRETEGHVLVFVYDKRINRSELRVIAADDFASPPVARIALPTRVPFGFHGIWVPT